jgi:hypothetical protein
MEGLTARIIDITENTIADQQGLPKINRKVSFLLVECFQNIIKHGETVLNTPSSLEDEGLFHFKNAENAYVINSINLVRNEDISDLKATVELVNSLDKESLREMYQKQLQESEMSAKGGAGLGLIEIARKSGNKLIYEFEKIDDSLSYFHQQVVFVNEELGESAYKSGLEETKVHYDLLNSEKVLLQYKGDFSQKSILPLLNIVESNIGRTPEERAAAKKVGHVLIETLQNISKHGLEQRGARDGIFIIGRDKDKTFIQAGNVISYQQVDELKQRLDYLVSLSKADLVDIHKSRIKSSVDLMDKSKSGLGLIEIAKSSADKLKYGFDPIGDQTVFFSLYVTV